MSLKDKLQEDLVTALKARESLKVATIRSIIGEVQSREKKAKTELNFDDNEVLQVIRNLLKQRREMAGVYETAGRLERAAQESAEGDILEGYLPKVLSEDEVNAIIQEELDKLEERDGGSFGMLMKTVNARVARRADGKLVAALVRAALDEG